MYGILVPVLGIEPATPVLEAESLNHWTTRKVPKMNHFGAQIVPGFARRSLKLAPVSLWYAPILFLLFVCFFNLENFFTFWHNQLFQDQLVSILLQSWS